jgi:hypothetical protein
MKAVMLDLETFGNGKNACIVQIGACYFNKKTGEIGEMFKMNVNAASSVDEGSKMDADTVYWWLKQSKEAIESITADPKLPLYQAMTALNLFLADADEIWSHATFDYVIIMETLKMLGMKPRFPYRAARDIRTLTALAKTKVSSVAREGVHHDALADCLHQVKYCVECFKILEKK